MLYYSSALRFSVWPKRHLRNMMTISDAATGNVADKPTVRRRFAPIQATSRKAHAVPVADRLRAGKELQLKAVVFDVDGTLCLPQNYMFGEMRAVLGIPKSIDILDHIYSLPADEQTEAMEKIKNIESAAMSKQEPQPGLNKLMSHLDSQGILKAICTRNFNGPVDHLLNKFLPDSKFSPIVTRDFKPPKPDPAGIRFIAERLGIVEEATEEGDGGVSTGLPMIMVGDSVDDMLAGRRAGAVTVLLVNSENASLATHDCTDVVISRLDELVPILDAGLAARDL